MTEMRRTKMITKFILVCLLRGVLDEDYLEIHKAIRKDNEIKLAAKYSRGWGCEDLSM